MAEGKKGRKIGRNKNRPAQKRYVAERRSEKNKRKNIERATKLAAKSMRVQRGTARAKRRGNVQIVAA